ncbi:SUMF1/EgtB/PvdO family nonheme iron enzyme [Alkalinema sp. FACHB-956]|uniref:SUMF1/EgtB/PvdO family nonheme iron enzyme n=1 Tax=Alkalinema sp. FACHB-956 TaxID=2692768 RepID=UPI001682CD4A|nr:SUMF1/EgtB/PvdO family nonheme iron enzyme [Alkalinema sp. FACHB-956]MBD2329157.1 SUMF1/EgtB/PvdO family nonheme iron enzyme [Alkalinema sp. FACHB-956]
MMGNRLENRYALVLGVGEYGPGLTPLPGSVRDAEEMARVLADADRGSFQVDLRCNVDRGEMEGAIERFFVGRQAEDVLLLYFSGHGDLGNSLSQQQLHLCGRGTTKEGKRLIESSAMSADFLRRQMGMCRSQQIVVILDCCYSGAIADLLRKGEGDVDFGPLAAPGRVILASSNSAQVSYQAVDGLSLYTHYLLEGMAGAAQRLGQPWILAQDLHQYAERRFEIEQKGATQPKIIVAKDEGYNVPIVKAPKTDPKVVYRQAVDGLLQELDRELGWRFAGEIDDPLDRGTLETLRLREGLTEEETRSIEAEAKIPYQAGEKWREYAKYFKLAIKNGLVPNDRARRRLNEIQQNLGLSKEDVAVIEQSITGAWNLPPASIQRSPEPAIRGTFRFETVTLTVEPGRFLGLGTKLVSTKKAGSAEYFIEDLGNGIALEMVAIPAGSFLMGAAEGEEGASDQELPQHQVIVPAFWMGKFVVTQAQWKVVAQWPKVQRNLKADPSQFTGKDLPVEQVSWFEAVEFCDRLSRKTGKTYRLPSEAEWEYACRAGTTTPFYCGETITTDLANYDGDSTYGKGQKGQYRGKTTRVGSFPPNGFGLYDMHGNVCEWCLDHGHDKYEGAPIDGSAWLIPGANEDEKRILRGGPWFIDSRYCRSATRNNYIADACYDFVGFRVVCSAPRTLS